MAQKGPKSEALPMKVEQLTERLRQLVSERQSLRDRGASTADLEVALLWQPETNRITVSVYDSKTGDDFDIEVDPAEATDAFHHPYPYAASRGVHFVAGTRISIDTEAVPV